MREINSPYAKTYLEIVIEFCTNTWTFHFRDTWYLQTQLHPRVFRAYCLLISPFVRFPNICFLKKLSSRRCLIFFFYILNVCKYNIYQKIFYVPCDTPAKYHLPLLARDFSLFTLFTSGIVFVRIKEFARKIPRHSIHELVFLKRVPFIPIPFACKTIYFAMLSKTLYIAKHCSLNSNWRESNFAKMLDRNRQRLIDFLKKKKRLLR